MRKKLSTFFVFIFVSATLFLMLLATCMLWGVLSERRDESLAETSKNVMVQVTEDLGQDYIDKIIFLGESTTYGLQRYGVLSGGVDTDQVWTGAVIRNGVAASAGTLSLSPAISETRIFFPDTQEAITIGEAVKAKKPEYLVITLGLNNGASYYSEKEFKTCYSILLDSVIENSPETKIILQSLFPVSRKCEIKAYTPERIRLCNKWINDIAVNYGISYLNTEETLTDEDGYLLDAYDNGGDGIHLNRDGLLQVVKYIRTHGVAKEP